MRHRRVALVSALVAPLALAGAGCATRGAVRDLEGRMESQAARIDALEQQLDQRIGSVESTADQALRRAEAAEAAARQSAQRADDAARRADAMFKKSVRK
jgi:murein lipoprotein